MVIKIVDFLMINQCVSNGEKCPLDCPWNDKCQVMDNMRTFKPTLHIWDMKPETLVKTYNKCKVLNKLDKI